jgi:hypothetical protein
LSCSRERWVTWHSTRITLRASARSGGGGCWCSSTPFLYTSEPPYEQVLVGVGRVRSSSPHLPAPPSHCVPVPVPVPVPLALAFAFAFALALSLSFPWSPSQLLPVSTLRAVARSGGWGCCCGGGRCGGGRRCAAGGSRPRSPVLPGCRRCPSRRGLPVCRSPPVPLVLRHSHSAPLFPSLLPPSVVVVAPSPFRCRPCGG